MGLVANAQFYPPGYMGMRPPYPGFQPIPGVGSPANIPGRPNTNTPDSDPSNVGSANAEPNVVMYSGGLVRPLIRWSVGPSVGRLGTLSLFGLLGPTFVSGLVYS